MNTPRRALDGSYFPRVLFFSRSNDDNGEYGTLRTDLYNFAARPEHKYFYSTSGELLETMKRALVVGARGDEL